MDTEDRNPFRGETEMTHESAGPDWVPRGTRRRVVTVILVAGILAVVAVGGRRFGVLGGSAQAGPADDPAGAMPPMPVDVDSARLGNVVDAVPATGRIEALQAVELRADEPGRVTELLFAEGQAVAAGTPLLRIDDALLRAQAERAEADRDLAQQQLERMRRLRAENAASPADMERVQAAARRADAELSVLQLQIERSTVRAPFAGVVGQRFVSRGDYVTTATPLLTLQTTDPQRAVIEVPERHAAQLRRGQTVEFTVGAHPGRVFEARVDFIDPVVQAESRTIVVKARAPNPERLLKAGMFIEARLAIATRPDAIVVREDAVQPLRTANVVWAVADGRASRRVVELGARSRGTVEIVSGVKAGETVVVGGLERMAEGMPVQPRPQQPPADSSADVAKP
jgi:membrane fusion protein (multidrug efflux system)